jgi:phosphoglycolate phosphatase
MIKALIFDLDGTLLSTDTDLCKAINQMRHSFNLESLDIELIKSYLGDGIRMLVTRSLADSSIVKIDEAVELFLGFYSQCYNDNTQPYAFVIETLMDLQNRGYRLSVVSNKAQFYVDKLIQYHFPMINFDCIYGDSLVHKRKPDPQGIMEALNAMKCSKEEVILVGDSTVDIDAAKLSNIAICPVAWGFQSKEQLFIHSKVKPIESISDIYQLIKSMPNND